jgi:dihydrolipoamide dehydrogenase
MLMDNQMYDVIVIGAGPGGYVCAIRCAQLGLKTAIVDKQWLGGVCLNIGCIPSKALLKNAEVAELLRHQGVEYGFSFDNLKLDYGAAVRRSRQASDRLTRGVGFLMKKNAIDVHMGDALIADRSTVEVKPREGPAQTLKGKNIVVATGARPSMIPGLTMDGKRVLTYREAILQETLPASVVVIGGGAIGVEFATVWHAYGADVTVVEMLPTLVPREDEEIALELSKQFRRAGIKVKVGTKVEKLDIDGRGVKVTVNGPDGKETLEAEQTLVAVGFQPNSANLGLEALGVQIERGFVQIDQRMQTAVPGIWAIGDVTGKMMLAHVASAQGIVCAEAMAGHDPRPLDYPYMPSATYSHPQVASFGLTEKKAVELGHRVKVARFPFSANGKAIGLGQPQGFVKIISEERYGEILGAHMIGPEVTELLPELTLAHSAELTVEEITQNVHAHPTLSETILDAVHGLVGGYIQI